MLTREDDVDAHKLHAKGWTTLQSPGIWALTARRSGPIWPATVSRANGPRPVMTGSRSSSTMYVPGWSRIRICGPRLCSMSLSRSATTRATSR